MMCKYGVFIYNRYTLHLQNSFIYWYNINLAAGIKNVIAMAASHKAWNYAKDTHIFGHKCHLVNVMEFSLGSLKKVLEKLPYAISYAFHRKKKFWIIDEFVQSKFESLYFNTIKLNTQHYQANWNSKRKTNRKKMVGILFYSPR